MYQLRIRALLNAIWCQVAVLTLLLIAARCFMFHVFVDPRQVMGHASAIKSMWLTGIRFDLRITAILLLPCLLFGLVLAVKERGWPWLARTARVYIGLVAFLIIMVSIINFYYYQTYHNFIDIFAFGLVDDDSGAVVKSIWQDYPIVSGILAAGVLTAINAALTSHFLPNVIRPLKPSWPVGLSILYLALTLGLLGVSRRYPTKRATNCCVKPA